MKWHQYVQLRGLLKTNLSNPKSQQSPHWRLFPFTPYFINLFFVAARLRGAWGLEQVITGHCPCLFPSAAVKTCSSLTSGSIGQQLLRHRVWGHRCCHRESPTTQLSITIQVQVGRKPGAEMCVEGVWVPVYANIYWLLCDDLQLIFITESLFTSINWHV